MIALRKASSADPLRERSIITVKRAIMNNHRESYERRIIRVVTNRINETIVNFSCFFYRHDVVAIVSFRKRKSAHIYYICIYVYLSRESQYFYQYRRILLSQSAQYGVHCEQRRVNRFTYYGWSCIYFTNEKGDEKSWGFS
jgi:hypothetical protein